MKAQGRAKDNAVLRTIANKNNQNFATRRILRDLKEIEQETIPTVGVTARPLENDLFQWHANILGPEGTIYEGGVFHFHISIPESYPHQPPCVTLLTTVPHPNIFGQNICLDMLNPQRGQEGTGWSSGYSIQSILVQLQSFLFEKQYNEDENKFNNSVKKAIQEANVYKCGKCKHGGKLSAWPEFNKKEKSTDNFIVMDFNENKSFAQELVCYHTKQSFKDVESHDKKETFKGVCLGLGLTITKVPRTGAIQQAVTMLDYISIKAFIKEGIRWSVNNEKFTNWMPLYFGVEDNKDRALHLGRKSLAMIMANSTRRFKPEFILEVFPKILITQIYMLVDQKRHTSTVQIRQLAHIHANFLMFMEAYPQLYEEVENRLQAFIKDESKRIKDHSPNLAVLLAYLFVSPKTSFNDLLEAYHSEGLDRQVFWIIKAVPELADEKNLESLNSERAELTFRCQITSYHILCLFKHYLTIVRGSGNSPKALLETLEKNYCKLSNKEEDLIQQGAFQIYKKVNDFNAFYTFVGMKQKSMEELNAQLKTAIKNSKAKKYHGEMDEIHTLPTSKDQIQALLTKIPKLEDFYETKTIKNDKEHSIQIKAKKSFTSDEWRAACVKRWKWVQEALNIDEKLTATDIAELSIPQFKDGEVQDGVKKNRIHSNIVDNWRQQKIPHEQPKINLPEHSWEQVFMKLDMEDSLLFFNLNPDFQTFYEKLEICKDKIIALTIPIVCVKNVKSGFHFITQTLSKLTKLEWLEIAGLPEVTNYLSLKEIKCINKGLNNFIAAKGSLKGISFSNFHATGSQVEITDKIFSPLNQMKDLISIKFNKNNILHQQNASKSLCNMITNLKNLQELLLTNNVLNSSQQAKEIADGLMRAKKLTIVDITANTGIGYQGMAAIIYNLAFATNLYFLKLNKCSVSSPGAINDVVEALFKLLKINSSLEILDCSQINNLNPNLSKDFCLHLGEMLTLRYINLEGSGKFSDTVLANLGKSIAFNAMKNGVLENINLKGTLNRASNLVNLHKNMNISDHDHEVWYGDPIKAQKMQGTDFDKKFYNNLTSLQFDQSPGLQTYFSVTDFKKYNRKDTEFMQLIAQSPKLQSLNFSGCSFMKQDADLFNLALDPKRAAFASNIKVIDLSKNNLGKEGAKIFANIFEINNIIEAVDLSKNQVGVSGAQELALKLKGNKSVKFINLFNNKIGYDGAYAFSQTFAENNTLEFVEFGHNRIRNKGLLAIADGIAKNKNSAINTLGLRFNFLSEDGVVEFLRTIKDSKNVRELFIKNNSINEYGLFQLKKGYDNLKLKTIIDIFEKLKYLDEDKLERTVYIHPLKVSRHRIKEFLQNQQKCGIIMDVRIRQGPKWPNRTTEPNKFAMIEFADPTSCTRALTIASRKKSVIDGQKFRIYKAGTGTFIFQKKTSKQKKAETSKTNILTIDASTNAQPIYTSVGRSNVGAGRGGRGVRR